MRALAGSPVVGSALLLVGLAAGQAGAQTLAPADVPTHRRLADSLVRANRLDAARAELELLTRANPDDGRNWQRLADVLSRNGRLTEAIAANRRALDLGFGFRPNRAYRMAQLFARIGSADSALAWLERALEAGFESRPSITEDSAFATLAGDRRFKAIAGIPPSPPASRDDGWRSDVARLAQEAKRLAAGPHPVALSFAFDSAVSDLQSRVGALSNEQMYVELQRLMTMLGNGHSVLFPFPTPMVTLTQVPVELYLFSDGLFVVGGTGQGERLIGSRVERIGDLTPADALERVAPLVTRDNPVGIKWNGPYFLTYPAIAHALGIDGSGTVDQIRLTLIDRTGKRVETSLTGGEIRPPSKLVAPAGPSRSRPLYLSRPDQAYWFTALERESAIYAQYNQVRDDGPTTIAQFAAALLGAARQRSARNLIIDVRRNNGGNGTLNRPLVRALVQFEGLGDDRQVYVIMGRNTFSAAQNFINDVERVTNALFAGEPSSSRPNFMGEDTEILLPYSGYRGSIASRYFQDSDPTDSRLWIPADIPVVLSSADYFGNRDPVLESVLKAARQPRPRRSSTTQQ